MFSNGLASGARLVPGGPDKKYGVVVVNDRTIVLFLITFMCVRDNVSGTASGSLWYYCTIKIITFPKMIKVSLTISSYSSWYLEIQTRHPLCIGSLTRKIK